MAALSGVALRVMWHYARCGTAVALSRRGSKCGVTAVRLSGSVAHSIDVVVCAIAAPFSSSVYTSPL